MAAIGLVQMKRYPAMLERRKIIIEKYEDALKASGIRYQTLPHYEEHHRSCGHLFICRLLDKTLEERNEIIIEMAERGIGLQCPLQAVAYDDCL